MTVNHNVPYQLGNKRETVGPCCELHGLPYESSSFFILESLMSHTGTAYIGKIRCKDITLVLGHLRIPLLRSPLIRCGRFRRLAPEIRAKRPPCLRTNNLQGTARISGA